MGSLGPGSLLASVGAPGAGLALIRATDALSVDDGVHLDLHEVPGVRRWYADMLIERNAPGDMDKARTLLEEAVAMYTTIGMPKHIELAERVRERPV